MDLTNLPYEPLLQLDEIQGNVLGGFNKDYQTLLYLRLMEELEPFRAWLRDAVRTVATANEVIHYNRLFKAMSARRGSEAGLPALQVTWINISFSHSALVRLTAETSGDLAKRDFADAAFRDGMAARAVDVLGDPPAEGRDSNRPNWATESNEPDVLVIVASETRAAMRSEVDRLRGELESVALIVGQDEGQNRPDQRDNFGFREAISQPGVRGLCSPRPDDFLTPRRNPHDLDEGLPGQKLVWPGEFVLGYRDEQPQVADASGLDAPVVSAEVGPDWAVNGSFLVFRRLRQEVGEFDRQVAAEAARLELEPDGLKARMLGRWPNGAPLGAELASDPPSGEPDASAAENPCTNNAFGFQNRIAEKVCPVGAHIRKAYPRDDAPNQQRQHRILRRGISFTRQDNGRDVAEHGLLFLGYQASLEQQFEYIAARMNGGDGSGYDLLVGQPRHGHPRYLRLADHKTEIRSDRPFVVPTGGGYFFTPSIWALSKLADPVGSWTPPITNGMLHDRVKFAYYELGRFIYEQAPYATGPALQLSADFYHTAKGGPLEIQSDGLAQYYGIHPLDDKPEQLFNRSSNQLTDNDQFHCLWWYFLGKVQRVTKAIRIPYRYRRRGQMNEVDAALLIGFAGPGNE